SPRRTRFRARGVSRRARALAFLAAAVVCALLAATIAGRYRARVDARYGPLRPVVVAGARLPAGPAPRPPPGGKRAGGPPGGGALGPAGGSESARRGARPCPGRDDTGRLLPPRRPARRAPSGGAEDPRHRPGAAAGPGAGGRS